MLNTIAGLSRLTLLLVIILLTVNGCGGGGSSSNRAASGDGSGASGGNNNEPENLDDLLAETSELWDSASRLVDVVVSYTGSADVSSRFADNLLRRQGYGLLEESRLVIYEDNQLLLADDFGDQFLEVDLSDLPQSLPVGTASLAISDACTLELTHTVDVDGDISQGWLSWTFSESVALIDTGGSADCETSLSMVSASLNTTVEYPYDVVTLRNLNAIDGTQFTDLSGWVVSHEQRISKYFRAIGDADFELAVANQRIAFNVFADANARVALLADQLTP